jgi:pyruvate dehydrogenase E1 component
LECLVAEPSKRLADAGAVAKRVAEYQAKVVKQTEELKIANARALSETKAKKGQLKVQLVGSGTILREVIAGAELLKEFGIAADIWSATSFNLLRREGLATERWDLLHPEGERRQSYVEQCLQDHPGPISAASEYMKVFVDQIRPFAPGRTFVALGTDGFGRSDTRKALRGFFEVDRRYVAIAALKALADQEAVPHSKVSEAIKKLGIDTEKPDPTTV